MLTIGRLAKKAAVSIDSVRFYERMGLLAACRKTASGYRLYDEGIARRIAFIKHAQRCGFSLPEIRQLLSGDAPGRMRELAAQKMQEIQDTMDHLRAMQEALASLLKADDKTFPNLERLLCFRADELAPKLAQLPLDHRRVFVADPHENLLAR
jgi:MerR family Zn(II)-responsive transcriptional regulator of zntA